MKEPFRIRSIPPRTGLDVLRESGSSVSIGRLPPKEHGQGFDVKRHVFQKPTRERLSRPLTAPENREIMWQMEIHGDYNSAGDLGLVMQFSGIEFINPSFNKSGRDYGPDSSVFYAPVGYKNGRAFLILATYGDIFESQVVATKIDKRPFFREEIYLPELTVTHDPTSMTVYGKNCLVVVEYNKL